MSDDVIPEAELEERSIHPVGDPGRRPMIAAILGVLLAATLLWLVNRTDSPATEIRLTDAENLDFDARPRRDTLELEVPTPRTPTNTVVPDRTPRTGSTDPLDRELKRLALQRAEAERRLAEQRRRAPILILNQASRGRSDTDRNTFEAAEFSNSPPPIGNPARADDGPSLEGEAVSARRIENPGHTIAQGSLIRGVLETAIQSDLPGLVRAVVAHDVYAFDGSRVLIPSASRLVGHYRSALVRGQTRVFIIWDRLLRPDGVSVQIASPGTDLLGRAGLPGDLDTHFFKVFGGSILLSLIDGAMDVAVAKAQGNGGSTTILQSGDSLNRAAEMALENSIHIPPTVHVDQGTPIHVFVAHDLLFHDETT